MEGDQFGRMIYLVLLLTAVGGWVMVEYRQRLGQALRVALAWGMIFVGLIAGYGLWTDIRRDVIPQQMVTETGGVEIPRAADGHYYLQLDVGGQAVMFLADTGATNVVLSPEDARSLGIDPEKLTYTGQAMTANGMVRTARVTLHDVRLGPYADDSLAVWVNEAAMDGSLLGMDYLGRFRIEIAGDQMVLRR